MDLTVNLGAGLELRNPVMTASGTFGYGSEYAGLVDFSKIGAIIVKGTTALPRQGNPYPRMAETPAGMLNCVGLQNGGIDKLLSETMPQIANIGAPIIINASGSTVDDYALVCEKINNAPCRKDIAAVELNISCPNVKSGGMAFGTSCAAAAEVVGACRRVYDGHLMVKLSPNVTNIADIAVAVEQAGADSVSLINTLLGMAIDVERRRPVLSTVTGGLSGPAVKPVALRMVWQVAKAVKIPVVGLGGICSATDAIEFIMAGARAVEVGTANFINPGITAEIADGIARWMEAHGVGSLEEITGII